MVVGGVEDEDPRSKAEHWKVRTHRYLASPKLMTELCWRNSEPETKNFKDSERVIE